MMAWPPGRLPAGGGGMGEVLLSPAGGGGGGGGTARAMRFAESFDVIVVGGGHAGTEAALASARWAAARCC